MATLWQMLVKMFKGSEPLKSTQIINPLKAKIGSSVVIDVLDYRDITFFIKEICEVSRTIGKNNYPLIDYFLLAKQIKDEDVLIKMRLMPSSSSNIDLQHNVVLLQKYDELVFNQDFRNLLNDEEFIITKDDVEIGRFWRINSVKNSYKCSSKIINEVSEKSVEDTPQVKFEYWDYWREFQNEANQCNKEFLFIEMESDTGYFTLWKGIEISLGSVDVR